MTDTIPMMPRLYDLICSLPASEILAACAEVDEDHSDGYPEMLARLKTMQPIATDLTIVIRPWRGEPGSYDVSGKCFGDDEHYAIEFVPWQEWLGATIAVEDCDLTPARVVAECFNELSWGGWTDNDRQERIDEIVGRVEEIREMIDEEGDG